jgi:tetratricopeptide (TPR) repeat protein
MLLAALFLSGCGSTSISWGPPFGSREKSEDGFGEPSDPRARASLQLTQQGKTFLEEGKPDDAINVLERAMGLDPNNGWNYYYLSEAWLLKTNIAQAGEYNRLAGIYLEGEYGLSRRVAEQKERIDWFKK